MANSRTVYSRKALRRRMHKGRRGPHGALPGGYPLPKKPYTLKTWALRLEQMIAAGQVLNKGIANWYRRWANACRTVAKYNASRQARADRRQRRLRRRAKQANSQQPKGLAE